MTFTELLDHLSIPFRRYGEHHHTTSGWISIDCPFCSPNWNHFRLGYNIRGGYLSCWSCGKQDIAKTLREITSKDYKELKPLLGDLSREALPPEIERRGNLVLPAKLGPLLKTHKAFLKRRKLDPDEIAEIWKLQGIGAAKRLYWRIFIPVHYRFQVVSWTTRSVVDKAEQRYISAKPEEEIFNHKDLLYGEHLASNAIVVVEGPTDCWRIGPGAVCTFGTAFRKSQVRRISNYPVRAIWFDNERKAQERAERLVADLEMLPGITYHIRGNSKDPGSASRSEIRQVRKILK